MQKLKIKMYNLVALLVSYFLVTEFIIKLPYFNLYILDVQAKVCLFYILLFIWFRLPPQLFILVSILSLVFGKFGEITGILIYVSLLMLLVRLIIDKNRISDHHKEGKLV